MDQQEIQYLIIYQLYLKSFPSPISKVSPMILYLFPSNDNSIVFAPETNKIKGSVNLLYNLTISACAIK